MNSLIRNILFVFTALISFTEIKGQGISDKWIMGYGPNINTRNMLDFSTGNLMISATTFPMQYKYTNSTITDSSSNVLFSTNGFYIADATGDTMLNGSGLNPSFYTTMFPDGLSIPQANLIIPKPGSSSIYYLFHSTLDNQSTLHTEKLYYSIIDMNGNGGLGNVTQKNQIIISDEINPGKMTATKHANGRDWWVFCHKLNSNIYYSLLITPYSIYGPFSQGIGIIRSQDGGQVAFSPDGFKFAYYWPTEDLEVFEFDRCTGLLSNPEHILINDSATSGGVCFSPNSAVLYVPSINYVYQFDVTAANIASTMQTVAVWDSFYSPSPPFATLFVLAQQAPDGKIYISTGNGGNHIHVINEPNQLGMACDMVQHGIQIPHYYFNTLPNHPNYFLGKILGSPCDTITGVGIEENLSIRFNLAPNPNDGIFSITYTPQKVTGEMEIYDLLGNRVYEEHVSQWSQYKKVDLSYLPDGVYLCRLQFLTRSVKVKFVKGR